MTKLLGCWALLAACAVAQIVEGSVVDSATGNGIVGVRVEFLQSGKTVYDATTDAKGHFHVEGVKPGAYSARYTCTDYWLSDLGAPRPFEANVGIAKDSFQVTAGGNPVRLEAHMTPLPRIAGRVIDGRGRGVADARVELAGARPGLNARTDGEGRFDMHQFLLPGNYTLSAAPPLGLKPPDPEPDSGRVTNWTRTYYPGVALPEAAAKILLRPGGEVWDIELKLLAAPAHTIRGVLLNPDGTPAPRIEISLGENKTGPQRLRAESKADGAFEFPAVVDGEWSLLAEPDREGVALQAAQWIEMAGRDIEGVKLRLNPPFTVRGKVSMERPEGAPTRTMPKITLSPHVAGIRGRFYVAGPEAQPDADGNFTLEDVYPGLYSILESEPAAPYYLDSVRVGEIEAAMPEVEFSSGLAEITLAYKTNGGRVQGTVEGGPSGRVVLVPRDAGMQRTGFLRVALCDVNGRYEFPAVRPGEYYALAVPGDDSITLNFRGLDEGLLKQAGRVTVSAGEAASADLRAISRPAN